MPATNARILALGGELQHAPVGRWATDYYLQRTVMATWGLAILVVLWVSLISTHPDAVPEIPPSSLLPSQVIDIRHYASKPPSIRHAASRVMIKKQDYPMPKPVPDSEIFEEPAIGTFEGGNDIGTASPSEAGTGDPLFEEGWGHARSAAPEVFLFVEIPPELVSLTNPVYPELAREAGVEGTVHVKILVSEQGFVLEAVVLEGLPLLEEAALAAAKTAIFRPAQQSGQPVRTWVVMPIQFSLRR